MRLLILTPSLPRHLDEKVPWHFFQEIEPLRQAGLEIGVVSDIEPDYEIEGIRFFALRLSPLKKNIAKIVPTLRYYIKNRHRLPGTNSRYFRQRLRLCRWNKALAEIVSAWQPDIIHSHWAYPSNSAGYLVALDYKIPLVMTLRGIEHKIMPRFGYGNCLDTFYEKTLMAALHHCDAITGCCSDTTERLAELRINYQDKYHSLYHAINLARFSKYSDEEITVYKKNHGLDGKKIITCIGDMRNNGLKGQADLIKAFSKTHIRNENTVLLLIGEGPKKPELERLSIELGIDKQVSFTGSIHPDEIEKILKISTCLVHASYAEVFANVVFEALLVGTPVIATTVGTPKDVLSRHGFGMLYEPSDISTLTRCLDLLFSEITTYRRFAVAGSEFVRTEMNLKKRIDGFITIYQNVSRKQQQISD